MNDVKSKGYKTAASCIRIILALAFIVTPAYAVPGVIDFQGKLFNNLDKAQSGSFNMTFTLYNQSSGGNLVWRENRLVSVSNGLFSVLLGSNVPLNTSFYEDYYLEVNASGEIFTPRYRIASVPYALRANNSEGAVARSASTPSFVVTAITSQSSFLTEWRDVNGNMLAGVNSAGQYIGDGSLLSGIGAGSTTTRLPAANISNGTFGSAFGDTAIYRFARNLTVNLTLNASNIVLANNCADGQVLKWSSGVGVCGSDSTGAGGAITGLGIVGYVALWNETGNINSSALFQSGADVGLGTISPNAKLSVQGASTASRLALNVNNTLYVNASTSRVGIGATSPSYALEVVGEISAGGSIFSTGINITGREIADNSTQSTQITSLDNRETANNATQAANISVLYIREATNNATQAANISEIYSRTLANNATIATNLSSLNDRINNEVTLQAANNATQAANISSIWTLLFGNNFTIENTALFFFKVNTGNLTLNGTLNVSNITLSRNCADGQVLKWNNGVGQCGTDTTSSTANISGSGTTGYIPKFTNDTHIVPSVIFTDNTSIGIGTTSPDAKLTVTGTNTANNLTLNISGFLIINASLNTTRGSTGGTYVEQPVVSLENNATLWIKSYNGSSHIDLKLGTLQGAPQYASYEFRTEDVSGDDLQIHSNRWGGSIRFTSAAPSGIERNISLLGGGNGWGLFDLYDNSNNVRIHLDAYGSSYVNGTLYVEGINITERELGDNSTQATNISEIYSRTLANNNTIESTALFFFKLNQGNLSINGSLNVSNITLSQNCGDGSVLKWSNGVGQCGSDSTAGTPANITGSGTTNFIPYFFNATHIVQSLMYVAGSTLSINYTSVNVTSTLYVNGANVTGTQIADNITVANNISSLNDRINNEVTLQAANNATQAANISATDARESANNATQAANISATDSRESANNATQATNISSAWTFIFGNNLTIQNTALFFFKLNQGNLSINGSLNVSNITLKQNCGDGQILKWSNGVGQCGIDATSTSSNISGSGATGYIPKFHNDTHLTPSIIFTDNTSIGIGTTTPSAKLDITGVNSVNGLSLNASGVLYVNGSSERAGIGTTKPVSRLDVAETDGGTLTISSYDPVITQGDVIGSLDFYARDADENVNHIHARIQTVAGTHASGDIANGVLKFYTGSPLGLVEVMNIDYLQNVGIGTTVNPSNTARLQVMGAFIQNNLSLNVNDTLYVNGSSNRVGIGTANPTSILQVVGDLNVTNISLAQNCANGQVLKWSNGVGQCGSDSTGTPVPANITGSGTENYTARFYNITHIVAGSLFDNGTSVGIGTVTPSEILEINGTTVISSYDNSTLLIKGTVTDANTSLRFAEANGIAGVMLRYDGLGNEFVIRDIGTQNTIASFERGGGGRVGIGTNSPNAELEVNGSILVTGIGIQSDAGDTTHNTDPSLRGAFDFSESSGSRTYDKVSGAVGTMSNFTFTSLSGWTGEGRHGTGLKFDETKNTAIDVDFTSSLNFTNVATFTVEAWVKPSSKQTANYPMVFMAGYSFWMSLASSGFNGGVYCAMVNSTNSSFNAWPPQGTDFGTLYDDKWHHIACSYDGTQIISCADGVCANAVAANGPLNITTSVRIGHFGGGGWFNGTIDSITVYNRSLSANEIRSHAAFSELSASSYTGSIYLLPRKIPNATDRQQNSSSLALLGQYYNNETGVYGYASSYIYVDTANFTTPIYNLVLQNGLTPGIVMQNTGRVGVGTRFPTSTLHVAGDLNVTNITLANNCADGQILKWANGVGTCGADSTGTANPSNTTISGATGYIPKFHNETHLIPSPIFTDNASIGIGTTSIDAKLSVQGASLGSNLSLNVNNTLYVNGSRIGIGRPDPVYLVDVKSPSSGIAMRVEGNVAAAGSSFIFLVHKGDDINTPYLRVQNNGDVGLGTGSPTAKLQVSGASLGSNLSLNVNNTLYVNASTSRVGIGTGTSSPDVTLDINGTVRIIDGTFGSSTTLQIKPFNSTGIYLGNSNPQNQHQAGLYEAGGDSYVAVFDEADSSYRYASGQIVYNSSSSRITLGGNSELQQLMVNGMLNVTNITLAQNCANGQVLKWSNGVGQCGTDSTGTANASASGATGYIPKFDNDTHIVPSVIFTDNTSIGIGTTSPSAKLTVAGANLGSNLSLNVSGLLFVNTSSRIVSVGRPNPSYTGTTLGFDVYKNSTTTSSNTGQQITVIENGSSPNAEQIGLDVKVTDGGTHASVDEIITAYGIKTLTTSNTTTADDGEVEYVRAHGGYFETVFTGGAATGSDSFNMYGVYGTTSGDIVNSLGEHTGVYSSATGTASYNYAFRGSVSGATNDVGITISGEDYNLLSGNLGIGTAGQVPTARLEVRGRDISNNMSLNVNNTLYVNGSDQYFVGVGTSSSVANEKFIVMNSAGQDQMVLAYNRTHYTRFNVANDQTLNVVSGSADGRGRFFLDLSNGGDGMFIDISNKNPTPYFKVSDGALSYDYLYGAAGSVGIGTITPGSRLDVQGANIANNLSLNVNNTLYVNVSGVWGSKVGIGTSSPQHALTVMGNISLAASGFVTSTGDNTNYIMPYEYGTGKMSLRTNGLDRISVMYAGNVGINTTNPTSTLHVIGNANISGNLLYGGNLTGYGADFAEMMKAAEPLSVGDVVCLNDKMEIEKCRTHGQNSVAGVVSARPTIQGNAGNGDTSVGIVGIVKTKVTGKINRFDMLTTSTTAGYAEKATSDDFGAIIGKAMEPCNSSSCTINVLVGLR